jgi:hypothetical protein
MMQLELGAGLWVLLALAVGVLAAREFGRSGIRWFLLALFFTPLVGLLLFILPAHRRPCPFCAEPIKPSAVVCRFCGREVPVDESAGLPRGTRLLLLLLVIAVMAAALSQCHARWWGQGDSPIQVRHGETGAGG